MSKDLPPPELLRKLLRYEPDTGKLFWRERTPDMFKIGRHSAKHTCNKWNGRYAGKIAMNSNDGSGYMRGPIMCQWHRAHRVIWAIETGAWPVDQIDHINGVRSDNRIANLRPATNLDNSHNRVLSKCNTSGVHGVCWHKAAKKWHAQIRCEGIQENLGFYDNIDDAAKARKLAETKHGFNFNHGR